MTLAITRRTLLVVISVAALVLLAAAFFYLKYSQPDYSSTPYRLTLKARSYQLESATTDAAKEKGLSGRPAMGMGTGMIFPYDEDDQRCFWMKDMRFPLDIIWVNGGKNVTHIEQGLRPAAYPRAYCFQARYVIELNAGEAAKNHLQAGQQLDF